MRSPSSFNISKRSFGMLYQLGYYFYPESNYDATFTQLSLSAALYARLSFMD